ncbi:MULTISPECIES: hypothetical protein [unclassified Mycoplasma]|uniref:hypothetical protein n=1 Tax=unclassified Mycoplasma TaxID=2683645 RepID=UPI00211C92E7|nr:MULTISPECIES: hypothetical protein [unclassified Mycoplasma]UUM20054.1 hypothetical protein NPA11_01340 [Mycoplasma sp. 1578d]UUM25034.1 hypothetical protein NPA12_01315 [Mycoplasma sp. 3686d]
MKPLKEILLRSKEFINRLKSLDPSDDDIEFIDKKVNLGTENENTLTNELKFIGEDTDQNNLQTAQEIIQEVGSFSEKDRKIHSKQRLGYALGVLSILIILGALIILITLFALGILTRK